MKLRVLSIVVVIIFTLLLTWCQNKFIISEVGDVDISSENKINGIINDNRVPVVIISNTNSWDIITQSWNELLYKNEVYWFQILLWEETKGVKIKTIDDVVWFYWYNPYYDSDEFKSYIKNWWNLEDISSSKNKLEDGYEYRERLFRISVINENQKIEWENKRCFEFEDLWMSCESWIIDYDSSIVWYNNWRYFRLSKTWNEWIDYYQSMIENLKCSVDDCWDILNRLIWKNFEIIKPMEFNPIGTK